MRIKEFTKRYPVTKTLRFRLIPQGKTLENFEKYYLPSDEKREKDLLKAKKLMNDYHKIFIDDVLNNFKLQNLDEYSVLFYKKEKTADEKKKIDSLVKEMRESISKAFTSNEDYNGLLGEKMFKKYLPKIASNDEDKEIIKSFASFSTYFTGFNKNRENIYTGNGNTTEIAYRIVDQNLPKYLNNCSNWGLANQLLSKDVIKEIYEQYNKTFNLDVNELFTVNGYNHVLKQKDIEIYNQIIGGYSVDEKSKVKGINEYINEYNQVNNKKIKKFSQLYKQVLSDRDTISFVVDKYNSVNEMLGSIEGLFINKNTNTKLSVKDATDSFADLLLKIDSFDTDKIYIKNGKAITDISKKITGDWSTVRDAIYNEYDENKKAKNTSREKYINERKRYVDNIESISLKQLNTYLSNDEKNYNVEKYLKELGGNIRKELDESYNAFKEVSSNAEFKNKSSINDEEITNIKAFLDNLNDIRRLADYFDDDYNTDIDFRFLEELEKIKETLTVITNVYNKTRNFIAKKPYSEDKIKITFNNYSLLGGWDVNKEADNRSIILIDEDHYYLGVINKNTKYSEINWNEKDGDCYEKMVYKQIPNSAKYFSSKQINPQNPPANIKKYLSNTFDKKTMTEDQLIELIKYVAEDFIPNYSKIRDENGNSYFNFSFKEYSEYKSWKDFCSHLDEQTYSINFKKISKNYINELVNDNKLYLFEIYCKDFSKYSHANGTKNLHSLYFKMLFDENNLKNTVYKLNGRAEMFYRKGSISINDTPIHKANEAINNKNPLNKKRTSTFKYDLIKNRRYTESQFFIHLPITVNANANTSTKLNNDVRYELRNDNNYIIGIDRGERNLLYISVIDENGKIIEERSFNLIINNIPTGRIETDYHALLDMKENERDKARKEWKTINNIKEIKSGYLSQVVHIIAELIEKYHAIISLEDLNSGFKNSRAKIEKQVYQKFEKALIDKLNYYVNKRTNNEDSGGLLNAYQLTNNPKLSNFSKQDGIIFYTPAWLTSKIDPTTGFVNLLKIKYESVNQAKDYINKFDDIRYDNEEDMFVFDIDYEKYGVTIDYKKKWTIYSNGDRILTFRNSEKNNEWDYKNINLTTSFKTLFDDYSIDYKTGNLKDKILQISEKHFYEQLFDYIKLTLQMRNSIPGTQVDYLISPVKNNNGVFFNSNDHIEGLPNDADANGAYHIALKALWIIEQFKNCNEDELDKVKLSISNAEWLEYVQKKHK